MRYEVAGDIGSLALPPARSASRADELWRHTCFEAFVSNSDAAYREFNFSPSGEWAAYRFDHYRSGMAPLDIATPVILTRTKSRELRLNVSLNDPSPNHAIRLNLAAVIEEKDGTKSYWALAHPPESPPDFHDPSCFTLELPPATPA
jgi:hypothetical protein